jgi:hypothetical protein
MVETINAVCPGCKKTFAVPAEYENKKVKCKCGQVFIAKANPPEPAENDKIKPSNITKPKLSEHIKTATEANIEPIAKNMAFISGILKFVVAMVIITIVLGLIVFVLKDAGKLPALSEKDVKLIEAFVHEMNLLVELQRENEITFKYQLAKLDAAYSDLSSLGSSNYPMLIMQSIALNVSLSYSIANIVWNSGRFEKYDEERDKASKFRELFLKAYHFYKPGVTIPESNKFLLDNGLAESPKNDSISK